MQEDRLNIGYEADFAPLTFAAEGRARGMLVDIIVEALGRTGAAAEFTPVPLQEHDAAIQAGRIGAVAFKAIIPDRQHEYDFSLPITTSGAAWFSLPPGPGRALPSPAKARLATPNKGPLIAQLRCDYPDAVFVDVDTYGEALNAAVHGDADYAALNFHVGCYLANRDHAGGLALPAAPFQEIPLGLAFAKGRHGSLREKFDTVLSSMQADGTVKSIERRWLGG